MNMLVCFLLLPLAVSGESSCDGRRAVDSSDTSVLLQSGFSADKETSYSSLLHTRAHVQKQNSTSDEIIDHKLNMCIRDRIAPGLFVLGAQHAGSSSFAKQLSTSFAFGNLHGREPTYNVKEHHVFDNDKRWNQGEDWWLQVYPKCTQDSLIVAADATPDYLYNPKAPSRILDRYGSQARRLRFVVLLREPLARMQSAFYFSRKHGYSFHRSDADMAVYNRSFQEYIEMLLAHNLSASLLDPFALSHYNEALERWFKVFDPDQFIIAPFRKAVGSTDLANHVIQKIGLQASRMPSIEHRNNGAHPALEDEGLPSPLMHEVKELLHKLTGAQQIAKLLVQRSGGTHAELFGFKGDPSSVADITKWLDDAW